MGDTDDPLHAALEELGRAVLELRRENHRLRREIDRLRPFEHGVRNAREFRAAIRPVLAAITWAEDLQEAQDLAVDALREVFGHDGPPREDVTSISPEQETSK